MSDERATLMNVTSSILHSFQNYVHNNRRFMQCGEHNGKSLRDSYRALTSHLFILPFRNHQRMSNNKNAKRDMTARCDCK